jgi:DNA-binding transcriptional LysR family regulator
MNLDTRIKFRHLLCFLEIARQGSLARAADVLAISQPAISKTLKELEDLLEARLFERTHLGVDLTPAGTRFMRYAGPSVQALRDGVGSVRGEARTPSQVRIGVLSTVEGLLMPEVLCRLHQRHEALVISVVTGVSAQLLGQLRLGELELVVGRMTDSPQIQGLSFEHLYSESMAWWCARATRCWPAHRWSGRRWGVTAGAAAPGHHHSPARRQPVRAVRYPDAGAAPGNLVAGLEPALPAGQRCAVGGAARCGAARPAP